MTQAERDTETGGRMEIRTVELEGRELRVGIRRGSHAGPPLLLFNGIGANLELVEPFVAALDDVEIIIFDIPGVGGSPTPVIPYRFTTLSLMADKLLTRLGYNGPVDVLGVSWGGALAQEFAHLYPERCRRLILAATSPGVIMVPGKLSVLARLLGPRRYTDPAYLQRVGGDIYGGTYRRDPGLLREHSRHIQPPRGRGYVYQLLAAWGWSSLPWLGALRQPTLVMHGNDDPIVPLANAKILAARIRKARLHVVDDGHLFLVARAAEVAPVIRRFLREEPN
ncbi:poly(3-hydroxyalkanoate) depolymerase [Cupriavidus oxalaticus]|uniref:poly(3-hydroxyalkanoate) depolymerase n=1 Tax=Cupriavidus oxalaticus TaxID=96344 RepID=UPI00317205E1